MKKTQYDYVTPDMLGLKVKNEKAPILLVVDKHILTRNLQASGYSVDWLNQELKKKKINSIEDVFIAQVDSDGELFVDLIDKK